MLPLRHLLDDPPASLQHDRGEGLFRRFGRGLAVAGLDSGQPVAERGLTAEAARRQMVQRGPQPAPELPFGQASQRLPGPGRGLEGGLHQVFGLRPVAAREHAGVAEQPGRVRHEAAGEFVGVVGCESVITHRPPPRP